MEDKLRQKKIMEKIDKKKKFICQFCQQEYTLKDSLKIHLRNQHQKTKLHGCIKCDKFFDSASETAEHQKADHKRKIYQCKFCDEPFGISTNMYRHMRNVCSKSKCLICSKAFTNPAKLKCHEETCCKLRTKKLETKSNDKFDSNYGKKHLLARIEELEEENRKMSLKIKL